MDPRANAAGLVGWIIGCAVHRPRDLLILAALVGGAFWSLVL